MSTAVGARLPIRAQLAGLALAAILPLGGLLAWNLHAEGRREAQLARDQVLQLAEVVASETDLFVGQAHNILIGLAARPAVRALDPARCEPLLADFLKLAPRFSNVVTMRTDGEVVCSAVPAVRRLRLSRENLVGQMRDPGASTIGKATPGMITGRWVVPLGRPLPDAEGRIAGAVAVTIDLARLPLLPKIPGLPPGAVMGIMDSDGTVLAHSGDPARFVGTNNAQRTQTRRILEARRGVDEEPGLDGVLRIRGYTPIPGTDWIAVASLPAVQVYAPARERALRGALVAVAVLAVVLLLAAYWARRLREPVDALSAVAAEVAGGNFAPRAPVGGSREIAQVAGQFNRMLDRLQEDIAERKRAEEALRESEARFRTVFMATSAPMSIACEDSGRLTGVNDSFCEFFGYAREELLGRTTVELGMWVDPAEREALTSLLRTSGRVRGLETRRRLRSGEVRTVAVSVDRVDLGGEVSTLSVLMDTTERKRAEEALREAEARQRQVLDSMFPFVGLLSLDGVVLEANRAPLEAAGLVRADVIGRHCSETWWFAYSGEVQARLRAALARAAAGEPTRYDETIRISGGRYIAIDLMFSPLRDAEGRTWRIVGSAVDITERKAAELRRQAYAKQLARVSQHILDSEEAARRRMSRELHDRIGQSLATLNLNLDLVRAGIEPHAAREALARLDDAHALVEEATRQARDLMAELHPPALEDFGLAAALRVHAEAFGARVGLRVAVSGEEFAPRLPPATELALFRIVQESLANAAKHAKARAVEIHLDGDSQRARISVSDDGRGFDAARAAEVRTSWGLAIMRERASGVGAEVRITSSPGGGTRVTVEALRAAA